MNFLSFIWKYIKATDIEASTDDSVWNHAAEKHDDDDVDTYQDENDNKTLDSILSSIEYKYVILPLNRCY